MSENGICPDNSIITKVEFSKSLLIVTFADNARFTGRRSAVGGEALNWGFEAYPSTMLWGKPYENETIDNETKIWIAEQILRRKSPTGFNIVMNYE